MQSSVEPTSPQRTRVANATRHPGKPDAPTRQRTPAQKQANDAQLSDYRSIKRANALLVLANIASVEETMEASQSAKTPTIKKGVCPAAKKSVKDSVSAANIPPTLLNADHHEEAAQGGSAGLNPKVNNKMGLAKQLVAAVAGINGIAQPQVDKHDLQNISLPTEDDDTFNHNDKAKVLAKVTQWMSHVKKQLPHAELPLRATSVSTATSVPLSSVVSDVTQSTGITSINDQPCDATMDVDEEATYGGFGEDCDSQEQLEAQLAGRGKQCLVEFTELPTALCDTAGVLKWKNHDLDDGADHDTVKTVNAWEENESGYDTELEESMEEGANEDQTSAGHRNPQVLRCLTAASRMTNQSCINVLVPPPKKVKTVPTNRNAPASRPVPQTPACSSKATVAVPPLTASNMLPSQSMKAASQSTKTLSTTSDTPPTVSNLSFGRFSKANLPAKLVSDGGVDDVWGISHDETFYALPLMVDTHLDLNSSTMDFSRKGPIVSVAYQRLCNWWHNIGSMEITIIMSFLQCGSSDHEIRDMADMLLEDFSFLYEDLDCSRTNKAFQSNFILQLLSMAHLQSVNGAMESVVCDAIFPPLYNYCSIIGLCGAALERALRMALQGHITLQMIQSFNGKPSIPKVPVNVNQHSGKESSMSFAFSDQNWGAATRSLTERVKLCTPAEITAIIDAAQNGSLPFGPEVNRKASDPSSTVVATVHGNPYAGICNSNLFAVP